MITSLKVTFWSSDALPERITINENCAFILKNWGNFCPKNNVTVSEGYIVEILLEYFTEEEKDHLVDLFCASVCVVSGFNYLETDDLLFKIKSQNEYTSFNEEQYYHACLLVQKTFGRQHDMNAICKFYVAHKSLPLHPMDLHPYHDTFRTNYLLTEQLSIAQIIIICYSILEELGLNIITKQNETSLISNGTKWNPEVYSRLSTQLTECGLDPNLEIMWLSRNGIDRPFKSKIINIENKCEWSEGEIIKDFNIKLTDAILELSYMRSKLASHNVGDRVTLLSVYDAENAFHLARIILLDYYKIKLLNA